MAELISWDSFEVVMPPAAAASNPDRDEYIRHLANELDCCIRDDYIMRVDPRFFSNAINWFKTFVMPNSLHGVTFTEVINCQTYDRYFGTFASVIEILVFFPFHYMWGTNMIEHKSEQYDNHLGEAALHDILNTTFRLIVEDGLDTNVKDYYRMTPIQHIRYYYVDMYDMMPKHLQGFLLSFGQLFKHGKGVVAVQQGAVRAWLQRKKEKRAAKLIEDWWFELVNSPYTACGQRLMKQRAVRWNGMVAV